MQRDIMEYDVVIVGGGPAGLSSAIHLKQLAKLNNQEISVCLLDKGSEIGSHIVSGCVMDPTGLTELIPNWQDLNFPINTKVVEDSLLLLSATKRYKLPIPKDWQNDGNYIISLSQLCRQLAQYAESMGVEIYPGFAAASAIISHHQVKGIITGDMGLDKANKPTENFQLGVEIRAKQTILAEGCRGSVSKTILEQFKLNINSQPQTYGLGIKEIWRVNSHRYKPGKVVHTLGYPLKNSSYGGGFIYHMADNLISIGFITGLDYHNPYISPYDEFQRFKSHDYIKDILINGERIEYAARTLVEGGLQALPKLSFPGGILVGDSAGFVNVPKIKGVHNAIKSGMIGAKAIMEALKNQKIEAISYQKLFEQSWLYKDLYQVRNVRPAFQYGLLFGIIYSGIDKLLFKGKAPWTLKIKYQDHETLQEKARFTPINYPNYDGVITFDKASSVYLANINHDDNQPCHLKIKNSDLPIMLNLYDYASPEIRYCPAGVYEIVKQHGEPILQINSQNCVHCKACDIKDPMQNINWLVPEAGSGPQYSDT